MEDTQPSRTSDAAAATRKRRSSILKSQRPPRAPLSELEFNVATPTDTAKSRRVSFSRRTGVAEFVTNEATTTWKNFYEEHNKTLESSGNDSEVKPPRPSVGHLGRRIFDQQFEEVEAVGFVSTLDDGRGRNIETSLNNVNFAEQLASLDGTADDKLTAPHRNFELSAFTDQQSKIFRDDLAMSGLGEITDRISVNFSVVQTIGDPKKDDLDEIEIDIARAQSNTGSQGNVVCQGPSRDRRDLSEYIEVDLNMTHVGLRNEESDMSITDTISCPKVQDVSKSNSSIQNDKNNVKDWVEDKENILVNPYVTPKETANFAVNEDSDKILVFDGKRLTVQSENEPLPERIDYRHDLLPNSQPDKQQRKTIVLNVNDDLPNFVDDQHASMSVFKGNHTMLDSNDVSMTQPLNAKMEINAEKRNTFIFENDTGDISITQAVPNVILPEVKDKRKTIVYESDSGNISVTEAVPSNLIFTDQSFAQGRRKTIVFEADEGNISITQAVPANIFGSNPQPDKRRTIVFETDTGDISVTEVVPSKIMQEKQSKSQSIDQIHTKEPNIDNRHFEKVVNTNLGNMEKNTMYNMQEKSKTCKAMNSTKQLLEIEVDVNTTHVGLMNAEYDMSITDAIKCQKVQDVSKSNSSIQNDKNNVKGWAEDKENILVNRKTIVLNVNDDLPNFVDEHASMSVFKSNHTMLDNNDISMTQPLNSKMEVHAEKRKTLIFENDTGDISMTQAVPNVILPEVKDKHKTNYTMLDNNDISMTQPLNSKMEVHAEKRKTLIFENDTGDISITQAVPNVILPEVKDKRKTIVYESDSGDISVTEAVPSNLIFTDQSFAQGRRKTIVFEDDEGNISMTQAVPVNIFRSNPQPDKRRTIVFETDTGDISVTEVVPSNIMQEKQSTSQIRDQIPSLSNKYLEKEGNMILESMLEKKAIYSEQEESENYKAADSTNELLEMLSQFTEKDEQDNPLETDEKNPVGKNISQFIEKEEQGNALESDEKNLVARNISQFTEKKEQGNPFESDEKNSVGNHISQFVEMEAQDNLLESDEKNSVFKNISQFVTMEEQGNALESDEKNLVARNISQFTEKKEQGNPFESDEKNSVGNHISQFVEMEAQDNLLESDEKNSVFKNISQFVTMEEQDNPMESDDKNSIGKNISQFVEMEEQDNPLESDEKNPVEKNISQFIENEKQGKALESDEKNRDGGNISQFSEKKEKDYPLESDEKNPVGKNTSHFIEKKEQHNPLVTDKQNPVGKNISQLTEMEEHCNLLESDEENPVGKNISHFIEKKEQHNLLESDEKNSVGKNISQFVEKKEQRNPLESDGKYPVGKNISQFAEKKEQRNSLESDEKNSAGKKKLSLGQMNPMNRSAPSSPIFRSRQFVVLSREDLRSNLSMAQPIDFSDSEDLQGNDVTADRSPSPRKNVHLSPEVIKTLRFEDDSITDSLNRDAMSPLRKTARGEREYMNDVYDENKTRISDLVKPVTETMLVDDKDTLGAASTTSAQVQASLISSSQIDLDTEMNYNATSTRILNRSLASSVARTMKGIKNTVNPSACTDESIVNGSLASDAISVPSQIPVLQPKRVGDQNAESNLEEIPTVSDILSKTGVVQQISSSNLTSVVSPSGRSNDRGIATLTKALKETEVEYKSMTGATNLLEASSSLMIVDDTCDNKALETIQSQEYISSPLKLLSENVDCPPVDSDSPKQVDDTSDNTAIQSQDSLKTQDSRCKVLYCTEPSAPSLAVDHVDSASRKRVYSPTKHEEHQHCTPKVDVTPKPASKMQKRSLSPDAQVSNIPAVIAHKSRTRSTSSPSQSPEKSFSSKSPIKSSLKSTQGDSLSKSESPMKYSLGSPRLKSPSQSPLKISLTSPPKSPTKSKSPSTKSPTETKLNSKERKTLKKSCKTQQLAEYYLESADDEFKGQILDVKSKSSQQVLVQTFTSTTSLKEKSERSVSRESEALSNLKSKESPMDCQPELIKEPSSNLVKKSVNVVAKINMLPFMGTRECEWDTSVGDTWAFLLLHGRLRLSVRLGSKGHAPLSCVRADTPVLAVTIEDSDHSGKDTQNPVAALCVRFTSEAMRHVIGRGCERAGQVPVLLRRCAGVARLAMRWGNAMHDAKARLAYTLGDDGCFKLKVANIPLRSVWEVAMRLELATEKVPFPRASDVCVHAVVADATVLPSEVHRLLAHVPHDWGHVPRTIWKIFRHLKNKRRDDKTFGL